MRSLERFLSAFEPRQFPLELALSPPKLGVELFRDPPPASDTPATARPPKGEPWDGSRLAFDPALKHFLNGWRDGAPALQERQLREWRQAHGQFMGHILSVIGDSALAESLVLRGSSAMPFWVGSKAREPKDLDFVVVPSTMNIRGESADKLRSDLQYLVEQSRCPGISIIPGETALSDIWTYDRVPGQRLVFRWRKGTLPWASTQIDLVFQEQLPEDPQRIEDLGLKAAGPELSLAWKLLWLHDDMHPQAKDLYDAMVLAEQHPVRVDLLKFAFRDARNGVILPQMVNPILEWVGVDGRQPSAESSKELASRWWARLLAAAPRLAERHPL